jgi:hypothetical protein
MIDLFIARLKELAPSLSSVSSAEELAALSEGVAPNNGACFVVPYREQARPNELMTGGFRQVVDMQVLIAFVVRRADDAKGTQRVSMFDGFKSEIEAAIAGWEPTDWSDPCELVSGKSAPFRNGASIYVQTWQTSRLLTGA